MSWSYDTVEAWVNTALTKLGYKPAQAQLGAQSVIWLQQRHAPGLAAMAQHIDFISAYQFTPAQGGDNEAQCPILLSESLQTETVIDAQTFKSVRQPLLLLPTLARIGGVVQWDEFETDLTQQSLNIEYERKSLRKVLVPNMDVQWTPKTKSELPAHAIQHGSHASAGVEPMDGQADAPSNRHQALATEILPRELVYVKTVQHYAGTLPPAEPLDNIDPTDNTSST